MQVALECPRKTGNGPWHVSTEYSIDSRVKKSWPLSQMVHEV